MKRFSFIVLVMIMILSVLTACGSTSPNEATDAALNQSSDKEEAVTEPVMTAAAENEPGIDSEGSAQELVFPDIVTVEPLGVPEDYTKKCDEAGKIEKISYTVVYENDPEITIEKSALVYVPYGYDPANQYETLYLIHGGGGNEQEWLLSLNIKKVIDNMIMRGEAKPMIIVTPTFYYPDGFLPDPSGVSYSQFAQELRCSLIPAVESTYATFANGDVSEENLVATREHRGLAGLSMGSMHTINSGLMTDLDLFSWYGSFSGAKTAAADISAAMHSEALEPYDIAYLFVANGTRDMSCEEHIATMTELEEIDSKLKNGENFSIVVFENAAHDFENWQMALYRFLPIVFQ